MSLNTILATAPLATTGFHIKATGTTLGNSLIWDNGTNVGIGNTNTSYTLDVSGTGRFTSNLLAQKVQVGTAASINDATGVGNTLQFANYSAGVFVTGSADSYIYKTSSVFGGLSAQTLIFQTRSDVAGGGFAFVGGSTPSAIATISNTGAATFSSSVQIGTAVTNYGTLQTFSGYTSPSLTVGTAAAAIFSCSAGQELALTMNGTAPYGINFQARNNTGGGPSGTSYPIIFNPLGGNVGIGTSSPSSLLQLEKSSFPEQRITDGTIGFQMYSSTGGSDFVQGTYTNHNLVFRTNAAERMRITSGGSVIVQSVRNNTFASSGNLQIFDNTNNIGWGFQNNTFNNLVVFSYNGVWNTVGYFTNGTGVYVALSDANKKKDFEDSTIGLKEVLQLKPTLYRMKSEDEKTDKHLGFIAQEVKNLIPQAYNQNGEDGDDDIFIGLTEMPIIAALTKAIQEQQIQIQNLQEQINILSK